jgi:L-aspartate oxidase
MKTETTDVVIIGSGVAGLSAALAAAPSRVTVLTKTAFGDGNSTWAQGGLAAAVGSDDSPARHADDTVSVGVGLNNDEAVRVLTVEGADRARQLVGLGAAFDRNAEGELELAREAAHSVRRILHAADATGAEIVRTLRAAALANKAITVEERALVLDLVVVDGQVVGALAMHADRGLVFHRAGSVILATGGSGQLYAATTNPPEATADGLALAARAGAILRDLEFVQFHPTALAAPGVDPLPLVTEALRGEGSILVDENGHRFAFDHHPDGELAPRDVVARAIARHRIAGHQTFLDTRGAVGDRFPTRFPTVFASCQLHGIDPRTDVIPVSPAAHYHMGGVASDVDGRSSVTGLWTCGEVSATGVHGANRLASNSLLEGLVFGARAGADAAAEGPAGTHRVHLPEAQTGERRTVVPTLRRTMWEQVGLSRDAAGLSAAIETLDGLSTDGLHPEAANMLLVSRMIARAAYLRQESRGAHYRSDFPQTEPAWARHMDMHLEDGHIVAETKETVA